MLRFLWVLLLSTALVASPVVSAEEAPDLLYTSKAIVTGQGETNRQPGFRDCLDQVILRVSGDQRLLKRPEMKDLRARAGSFVQSFSYHDRLAGKPVHDEQGTHDRPHDLSCRYETTVINRLLAALGSHPWLGPRPELLVVLDVQRLGKAYRVDTREVRDQPMRESFENAAAPLAMHVTFPAVSTGETRHISEDRTLLGTLVWSDADRGWVATWTLPMEGMRHQWQVKGVNFDEAFRVAIRGAAQILSGNDAP